MKNLTQIQIKVSLIFGLGITAGQNTPKEHINLMV